MKVGDKVRIRPDLVPDQEYGEILLLGGNMKDQRGKIGTIIAEYDGDWYVLTDTTNTKYIWSEEMLELINEEN